MCTAGITADGRWIRLYPIRFRYWDEGQQYNLYDWVELKARKRPPHKDKRKESYEPAGGEVRIVGHVGTKGNWAERKRLVLPHARTSIEELLARYESDGESLGIIKPREINEVKMERVGEDWSGAQRRVLEQGLLWDRQPKPLEKMPYRFSYGFRCDDSRCKGHAMQITDWGLYYLFLKLRRSEGDESALTKTRQKCEELAAADKDTHLYVGTVYPHRSCIVIGMFYPKKERPGDQHGLPLG